MALLNDLPKPRECPTALPVASMHLVVIGGRDPADSDTWSGTPRALIGALREERHRVSTIGPLRKIDTTWPRLKAQWYSRVRAKTYLVYRDPTAIRRRAASLAAALRALEPYDAVIAWHAADGAIAHPSAPLIFINDAIWPQLVEGYPHYDRKRLAQSGITGGETLDRAALANCDCAIYSSHWAANAARFNYGTPAEKLLVHPFGANLPLIPSDDALRQAIAERGRGPCRLLFIGLDWQRKGGDTAVAVACELNDRGMNCEIDIVGESPIARLPSYARLHGPLPPGDAHAIAQRASLFMQADFLILPTHADCTPIVLSEAAAYGLPVATTAVGGIPELIGNSGWGKAFPSATTSASFADWIESGYRDRAQYDRMAWSGRHEYASRLNWSVFSRAVTRTIADLRQSKSMAARASAGFSA
ncbi:MAG: glycosyltransferase family 4 protein [Xanthobacteraceae bacterium]